MSEGSQVESSTGGSLQNLSSETPGSGEPTVKERTQKQLRMEEVKTHITKDSLWVVIKNGVYDITRFVSQHPGGEEILFDVGGTDATEAFEDIGHSTDARELLSTLKIGDLCEEDRKPETPEKDKSKESSSSCSIA